MKKQTKKLKENQSGLASTRGGAAYAPATLRSVKKKLKNY